MALTRAETHRAYAKALSSATKPADKRAVMRELARRDLFFLLVYVLGRVDVDRDWVFDRCRETQASPNGHLDLWARYHYKSSIITQALTIQDILNDPEITVCILSVTRPIAKGFLSVIKREFEANEVLKELFPGVLWSNPKRDAPRWSEDFGIIVRRRTNPVEATLEAWGLVEGLPTSRHFKLLVYDDVVTMDTVTSPDMIQKVTAAWENSLALTTEGGVERYCGTRYHHNDTYSEILRRRHVKARVYPATVDGEADGVPVLLDRDELQSRRRGMGPYTFACQMLLNPTADSLQAFDEEWLSYWEAKHLHGLNIYIICDPANDKKKSSDYTVFGVIGLGADKKFRVVTLVRDRLNLKERADMLFSLHREYEPIAVAYEKYGMQSDIEHFEDRMERENYKFEITPVAGNVAKSDRIGTLIPLFEQRRVLLPANIWRVNYLGVKEDLVKVFVNDEYKAYPAPVHDDMLDMLARVSDSNFPMVPPRPRSRPQQTHAIGFRSGRR